MTEQRPGVVSRRQFLAGSAALSLGAVLRGHNTQISRLLEDLRGPAPRPIQAELESVAPPSFTFSVTRDTDLALLDFAFYGFQRDDELSFVGIKQVRTTLVRLAPIDSGNVIVVQFPPQSIGEAAYNYETTEPAWYVDPPPVLSVLSGFSRLCFTLPLDQTVNFPTMTAADLLDWSGWNLLVPEPAQFQDPAPHRNAVPGTLPVPSNPTLSGMLTYIEYPYGLYLAPTVYSGNSANAFSTTFTGRQQPLLGPGNIADCWSAALSQTDLSNNTAITATGAAVWARDYGADNNDATPEQFIDYSTT